MPPKPSLARSFEHLHAQAVRRGHLLGRRGQVRGHQVGRSGVHQVTDQRHGLGQDLGPADGVVLGREHDLLDVAGRARRRPVPPEGVAAEQGAQRHRLGLVSLVRRQCDGDAPDLPGGPRRGRPRGSQVPGGGTGRAAQPLQVGQAILAVRAGRPRLRAEPHGHDDRGPQPASGGDLGDLLGFARRAERGERGHQVDIVGAQREHGAVRALEYAGYEGVRVGRRRC
jgi:hypothetical protein